MTHQLWSSDNETLICLLRIEGSNLASEQQKQDAKTLKLRIVEAQKKGKKKDG
tara:strand:+ start:35 stop:193 length:159 start_codon:yes stop_codon:yes gene_type:complete